MPTKLLELGEIANVFVGLPTKAAVSGGGGRSGNVLTVRSLTGTTIDVNQMATVELEERDLEKYTVQPGDVLMSARSTILKTAIVPSDLGGQIINATVLGIRTLPKLEPRLFIAWLEHPEGRAALEGVAQSGTVQMNITVAGISKIKVPVPPLEVQRQLVKMLEAADEAYHASIQAAEDRRRSATQVAIERLHSKETQ